jgi:hypothetical protein
MYAAHGRIGAAFYDAPQRKLLLLEDAPELGLAPSHVPREPGADESAGGSTASTADDARAKEVAEMCKARRQRRARMALNCSPSDRAAEA